jgi:uncharacterized protein
MTYWQNTRNSENPRQPVGWFMWMLASLPIVLMLCLLFGLVAFNPARAAEIPACTGHNMLPDLQKNDPTAYAAMMAEGEKLKNGSSIFWKLEKTGLAPSWLLGTMHMSDPRVIEMPKGARQAFEQASSLIVESDEILDQNKATASLMAKPDLMMFTDGKSITDYLSPQEKSEMEIALKARGIPLFSVSKMKPWVLSSFVALPACEIARKTQGQPFLDQKLVQDATASGKTIKGLETLQEQMTAMASLSMEFHVKGLLATLKSADRTDDLMETMIELYIHGTPGMIMPLSKYAFPEEGDDSFNMAEFEQKLVLDRNIIMANRAADTLSKGNAFMAVGALHLSGDKGLVELLRAQGYTVTAVN